MSKQAVKASSTELLTDDSDLLQRKHVDVDSCTDEIVHNILDLYKKIRLDKSCLSEEHEVSQSIFLHDQSQHSITEIQKKIV